MVVKVPGPGCPKCDLTEKRVREAIAETRTDVHVEKVTDVVEIAKYGVFMTPALIVDDVIKCVGKIPEKDEIKAWIS